MASLEPQPHIGVTNLEKKLSLALVARCDTQVIAPYNFISSGHNPIHAQTSISVGGLVNGDRRRRHRCSLLHLEVFKRPKKTRYAYDVQLIHCHMMQVHLRVHTTDGKRPHGVSHNTKLSFSRATFVVKEKTFRL